jgi:hypothetical protein
MPITPHDQKIEPPDDTEIWRFLKMRFFRDLVANEELYFRRTDLYKTDDPEEGLPTDSYLRRLMHLRQYVLDDELELNSHQAQNRLFSESQYLCCWNMNDPDNRLRMWYKYAPCGVAVRSEYGRLKAVLSDFIDDVNLGQVRYGDDKMSGYNAKQIIFTKRQKFAWENEVRAVVCSYDPVGGQARNYRETNFPHREPQEDLNPIHNWVHPEKRRRIDLKGFITAVGVSPWASEETLKEVEQYWAKIRGNSLPVTSDLKSSFTPNIEELRARGWGEPGDPDVN